MKNLKPRFGPLWKRPHNPETAEEPLRKEHANRLPDLQWHAG